MKSNDSRVLLDLHAKAIPTLENIMLGEIQDAKDIVIKKYEGKITTDRRWLEAILRSYDDPMYDIRCYVLEGSPMKGYVIADYSNKIVTAFDGCGNKLYKTPKVSEWKT